MTKVLITGGAGFIGSHLVDYLLHHEHEVFVLDNLATGSLANLDLVKDHPAFHLTIGDAADRTIVKQVLPQVDQVYHLAASVGVKHIMDNLIASIENNINSTRTILDVASDYGTKVLFTSSSEVYGKSSHQSSRETDSLQMGETTATRWSYACAKALDEYLAFAYSSERDLPVTVVRLFNTVGDRQSSAYGMVVPTFIEQALRGQPLTIYGDGSQSRCFVYVKDVVWALSRLMEHPESQGQVYNVGSTELVTINELADRVIRLTQSTSRKQHIPYEQAYKTGYEDTARRQPKIEKIKALIGFEPQHSLDDIIRLTSTSVQTVPARA